MKPTINLRQALASNPTRFVAASWQRPAAMLRISAELEPLEQADPPPHQTADARPQSLADQLRELGLHGMAGALAQLKTDPSSGAAPFVDWVSHFVEAELADRKKKRLASRLRAAKLRYQASIADLDYNTARGLDDALFHWLALGKWIADRENVIIEGPTGVGKTWLACALGEKACRDDRSVRYERLPRLLTDLSAARGTGRYSRRMRALHNAELLILDDWGLEPLGPEHRRDLLEVVEDRFGLGSTLIASHVAVERWPQLIGDAAIAAAVLDRITHNAYRLQLKGGSLRSRHKIGTRSAGVPGAGVTTQPHTRTRSI